METSIEDFKLLALKQKFIGAVEVSNYAYSSLDIHANTNDDVFAVVSDYSHDVNTLFFMKDKYNTRLVLIIDDSVKRIKTIISNLPIVLDVREVSSRSLSKWYALDWHISMTANISVFDSPDRYWDTLFSVKSFNLSTRMSWAQDEMEHLDGYMKKMKSKFLQSIPDDVPFDPQISFGFVLSSLLSFVRDANSIADIKNYVYGLYRPGGSHSVISAFKKLRRVFGLPYNYQRALYFFVMYDDVDLDRKMARHLKQCAVRYAGNTMSHVSDVDLQSAKEKRYHAIHFGDFM